MTKHVECFRRRRLVFGVALCGLTLMAGPAWAQGQNGTIFGQVADASGAVLPGVTVTVTSPALQVQQMVAVTDTRGEYRVTPLPLGTYTVEYALPGFQTQRREGIRLTAGFVARLDVALAIGDVAETITVSGASPVVDVKTTTAGTQMTREVLEVIPTSRNSHNSLLTLAAGTRPQVDTGQSLSQEAVMKAFGRTGDSWITIDGLPVSPTSDNTVQTSFNYGALEEAAVQTLGTNADAPTSGIQLNIISKSGSNDFHGELFAGQTWDWLQSSGNLDDALKAQGLQDGSGFSKRWDRSGDLGGRLVRDKLWFYTGGRRRVEHLGILGAFFPDGSQSLFRHDQRYWNNKGTYQLTSSQQIIGSFHWREHRRNDGPLSRFAAPDTIRKTTFKTKQPQVTWQWVMGSKVLSVQGGNQRARTPVPPLMTDHAAWVDDVTGFSGGLEDRAGRYVVQDRFSYRGTLNWYKPDWSGNHDFKIGALYTRANQFQGLVDNGLPVGNYSLRYRSGVPSEIRIGNNPIDPQSYLGYLGVYVQDGWAVNRRLTLNLGIRYANDRAWLPDQCRVAAPREFAGVFPAQCWSRKALKSWNPATPRLHAAYDLLGDAKTVIKGGWGRYYRMHDQTELDIVNPNARKEARYRWRDLNNNQYFDAGETNLDLNGPDFVSITDLRGPVDNPDLKPEGSDEFGVSLERELIANFAMRVTGLYVREFNAVRNVNPLRPYEAYNIPITRPDAGPDNRLGTADDPGTSITYYDYPASLRGAAFESAMFINHAGSNANFRSFELALNKRLSNRWQMLSSYSVTKQDVPVVRRTAFNPNAEIFAANNTWEWVFRATASYELPGSIVVSSNTMVQSGFPWARTVSATGGTQIPSIVLFVEPMGAQQTPVQTLVALAVQKRFHLRAGHRLTVGTQFLNLLNANFDVALPQSRGGPSFGYATTIVPPRLGDVTLQYSF